MTRLGFVVQKSTYLINPLLRAGPSILVCVENPGLIDSLKPLAPDALYIYRDWTAEQPLDNPKAAAIAKVEALKPVIEKSGERYHGVELYNEITQNKVSEAKRFRDFQLHCLDLLTPYDIDIAVDNDSTRHPQIPQLFPQLWEIKSQVYDHPAATWRCRHEYLETIHYQGGKDQWFRYQKEIDWLRANGKVVLPHYIGEWGWDMGPPIGPWAMGVTVQDWIQGAKDHRALLTDDVIAYCYFGAGLDQAWPHYNLTSRRAPNGIVQAVAKWMLEDPQPQPDPSWARVPEAVQRWYPPLKDESFRLWPHQTIPFKGVELHGDRIGACIISCESGGNPDAKSISPALIYNGQPIHAWGLMQIIPKVPGHPWFSNRPTIEELLKPAINVKWGMGIFHGSLLATQGDLWEALRRYSGFAGEGHTMAEFWAKYGQKIQARYKEWWSIDIPPPMLDNEVVQLRKRVAELESAGTAARNTLNGVLP